MSRTIGELDCAAEEAGFVHAQQERDKVIPPQEEDEAFEQAFASWYHHLIR